MPDNPFDKAARFAAQLDPPEFLAWVLGVPAAALGFSGWLDTRSVPFPGEPDRVADTVARLDVPGGEVTIIERWKRVAEQEPVSRRRSEDAGLALVFAEAAGCNDKWKLGLRGGT